MAKRATTKKINAVTKRLFGHYKQQKIRKAKLEKERAEFFDLLAELTATDPSVTLAQKTVEIPEYWFENSMRYLLNFYPEWQPISVDGETDAETGEVVKVTAILRERPEYKAAHWINERDGLFVAKQVRAGQVMLDDEWMQDEDPWLYNDLLERVWQIKDMDQWTTDQATAAQRYIYRDKPKLALQQPREATPEELGLSDES